MLQIETLCTFLQSNNTALYTAHCGNALTEAMAITHETGQVVNFFRYVLYLPPFYALREIINGSKMDLMITK